VRKLMRGTALAAAAVLTTAVTAAAQDVIYRFEQRMDGNGGRPGQGGDVFTLPLPPGGPGGLIEQQLAAIGPIRPPAGGRIVTIMNPVEGVHYSLDPVRKVAMRSPMPARKGVPGGVARTQVVIGTGPFEAAQGGHIMTTDVDTIVTRRGPDQGRTETLGTSLVEGVQAEGTRTVVTIPAGTIGNQAPIEMVSERWFSPELGVVVMSRRTDPRFGETTYRLQNIARGEPSPELFQVPPDYTVEALPAFGGARMVRPSIEP
jgi:hypothetical protein